MQSAHIETPAHHVNPPRCSSSHERIRKKLSMEYYSAIKKNENMSFAGKWMELKIIILSEISQTEKDKDHVFSFVESSLAGKRTA
jgi:hypothetical protein